MSLRILLADESSTIKKAFEIGLNSFGAEIKNVQHGIDVLEVAEHFNPDIIFADVLISKMNGYEVCAQIKQHKKLGSTPVVLMWSGFMDIDEDKYFTCQADGKIEKPFSADQLMSIIQTLVQKPLTAQSEDYSDAKPEFNPMDGTPPPLSQLHKTTAPVATPAARPSHLSAVKTNPTDDLLLKEDLNHFSDTEEDDSYNDGSDEEDFGLDGFQALDLHEETETSQFGSHQKAPQDLEDFFGEEYHENTAIPTAEEEAALLSKVREDSQIRHGHGFLNAEMRDELSNPSIDLASLDELDAELTADFESHFSASDDLSDLDLDSFDSDLISSEDIASFNPSTPQKGTTNFSADDIFSADQKSNTFEPNTIHRDVDDLHNSDSGMLDSADEMLNASTSSIDTSETLIEIPKNGVHTMTKDELKKIIEAQAKDVIQAIVWELIPEISKQMIEKEIKRLLADHENLKP